jgi:hypothetical protein
MLISAQLYQKIAAPLYLLAFLAEFLPNRKNTVVLLFLLPAVIINIIGGTVRYIPAWPMLPMHLGPVLLPAFLGLMYLLQGAGRKNSGPARKSLLAMGAVAAMAVVLFPKDFYLPFIKSQTLAAHFFLLFGTLGKACFLAGSAWALEDLLGKKHSGDTNRQTSAAGRSFHFSAWGFCFWTLSMFSGELWSYLGWGTPIVWDDPAITGVMATWFFYICLLHLHLTGTWSLRSRSAYAAIGALVIAVLNIYPDLGPFRWPL